MSSQHTYGRIAPSPLLQDGSLDSNPIAAFDWYFQSHIVGNADHLAANKEAYLRSLDAAIEANDNLKNLPAETKLMVTIPVSGNESATIYETLKLYTTQDRAALGCTQFVLIVTQAKNGDISEEESSKTYEEIIRAQKNFPSLHLTLLSINWPKSFAKKRHNGLYSASLKIVTDTCMRAAQRKQMDPVIITNDANPRAISRNYLLHYLRAIHENPQAEVFLGKIHWDLKRMRSVPGYGFLATVLMAAQDRVRESFDDIPLDSWAANSGYRASRLAAIGGVDGNIGVEGNKQGLGADMDIGRRFFAARATNERFCMVHEAWVDSYGDRLLRQYLCNKSLTRAWDEYDNNASSLAVKLFVDMTENVTSDFDHVKRRIEHLLGLMFSDQDWACFDHEEIITLAMNTVLLGSTESKNHTEPLWIVEGKRHARVVTFTDEGAYRLSKVLPQLADIIQDGLAILDDTAHAELHSNKKFLETRPLLNRTSTQIRRIGSWALAY